VLRTLAGLVLGIPASFVVVSATPQALAGPAAALMIAACVVLKLRSQPPPVAAPRRGWTVFFGAAATTASSFLVWLLVGSCLASLWPIFRFSPH
jgi:hypothetical protein